MSEWVKQAINKIESDYQRSADTHLIKYPLPNIDGIELYLKDESTHPTGSLKHRLARSLFLYGLCNGNIQEGTTIVESSSGSTAVSEAYFAQILGLPFIAVVPQGTSEEKVAQIEFYGGRCHFVPPAEIYSAAAKLAEQNDGHYMDQFTYAERATDWRGNNNIAESIFMQMQREPNPIPAWVVVSAGTGGTSATIGRYIRFQGYNTKMLVADPSNSVFYDYFKTGDASLTAYKATNIEGIGRPRVEPSFIRTVVDDMSKVNDVASIATMRYVNKVLNKEVGGSTGTNLYAAFALIAKMRAAGETGSVVSMICDSGSRYKNTYYNSNWLVQKGLLTDIESFEQQLAEFHQSGQWSELSC
ncbi:PLP-dependent cysteine synthase family protein [Planctobacterium marinum]|uniref:L-cysteine desulfhydrase Cds1 n=1 Tax=Planctobacterium marinum TaxID=1631968 RepID=A0AA48HJ33_9ALTE|nr:cysteine synthase [Planctobacterium marinum]